MHMSNRLVAMGVIVATALLSVVGCASTASDEATTDDDVNVSVDTGAVAKKDVWGSCSPSTNTTNIFANNNCTGATKATQAKATGILRYLFGDASKAPPTNTSACVALKSSLDTLRNAIAQGENTVTVTRIAPEWQCDIKAVNWEVAGKKALMDPIFNGLQANTDACYGQGTFAFLMPWKEDDDCGITNFYMEPEAATLTANLGATSGASAAAYYENSLAPANVVRWGTGYSACSSFAVGGQPCVPPGITANAGYVAQRVIVQKYSSCACP
jgi:hypothetical protein